MKVSATNFLVLYSFVRNCLGQSALEQARQLEAPAPASTISGEYEGAEFWETHMSTLTNAWREWEQSQDLPWLDDSIIDSKLREAVSVAWKTPLLGEDLIQKLASQVAPGVFQVRLLDPNQIGKIRQVIDSAQASGIPKRRPNGMNRYGVILSSDVEGAVNMDVMNRFYTMLSDRFVRPLGRLFFSDYVTAKDDIESYAFTVRYQEGEDIALKEHTDASVITLNVNLNLPEEEYEGSSLYFLDNVKRFNLSFAPGMALIHRGQIKHAALPIERGSRTNLIVWLFGKDGYVRVAPYNFHERLRPMERWEHPSENLDEL